MTLILLTLTLIAIFFYFRASRRARAGEKINETLRKIIRNEVRLRTALSRQMAMYAVPMPKVEVEAEEWEGF